MREPYAARVRVSARVIGFLEGTDAWQTGRPDVDADPAVQLMGWVKTARKRRDGSVTVPLSIDERNALYRYAEIMAIGAKENTDSWGEDGVDARADLAAARGLLRQLEKVARGQG